MTAGQRPSENMTSGFTLEAEFLGTLAKILADLSGYDTLAFELIQNADDAKATETAAAATTIAFDVDDEAVRVWNDGEFSWCETDGRDCPLPQPCDLHSFLRVASETKRGRDDTTGAFGVGFTAVYQVTDRPELISAGVHLTLQPELANPADRVVRCDGCERCKRMTGTTFRLPWAAADSQLRQRLRVEPRRDPEGFVADLKRTLIDALPFLRRVEKITLRRDGELVGEYRRECDGDTVQLIGPGKKVALHRLIADFNDEAAELRAVSGSPVEEKRTAEVEVLIGQVEGDGRLYATLPTQQRIPAHMLLGADFFPHSSRKVIALEHDVRSNWNRAALRAGARAVAEALDELPEMIGDLPTWELIASIRRTTVQESDEALQDYWPIVSEWADRAPILLTAAGIRVAPSEALFVTAEEDDVALELLHELGAHAPAPELRRLLVQLPRTDLGMHDLGPGTLAELLASVETGALSTERRRSLWELMDRLLRRTRGTNAHHAAQSSLAETHTAPEIDGEFVSWDELRSADAQTLELFRPYSNLLDSAAIHSLEDLQTLAAPFKVPQALDALVDQELDRPLDLLRWFCDRKLELRADDDLQEALRALPIFPARRGREGERHFAPLDEISLPADRKGTTFQDVIGIAAVLDTSIGDDLVAFITDLGIESLDLASYVEKHAVPALEEAGDDIPDWLEDLLLLLASHMTDLEATPGLMEILATVALVPCSDGRHRLPGDAYFRAREVLDVLGADVPTAVIPAQTEYLLDRLGVAHEPRPADILDRVRSVVVAGPPTAEAIAVVHAVLTHFAHQIPATDDAAMRALATDRFLEEFGELCDEEWLPARDDDEQWFAPDELFRDDEYRLFSTQAKFLDLPQDLRNRARFALDALGIGVQAPLDRIVSHLLHCGANGIEPHQDVYRRLSDNADADELEELDDGAVLCLADGVWARPDEVFWGDHHLAPYAYRLDAEAWDAWRPLLRRLGVRDEPDHRDAIRVLQHVDADAGDFVDDATEQLVLRCWQLLEQDLDATVTQPGVPAIDAGGVRAALGNVACVIQGERRLARPPEVFVDDSPDLARRFGSQLGGWVITRPRGAWNAMRAAGVRGLRECSLPKIRYTGVPTPFAVLARHLREREAQIARVIEDAAGSAGLKPALMTMRSLAPFKTEQLEVAWIFGPDPRLKTEWSPVDAIFDHSQEQLYVGGELDGDIWIDLARELAAAIAPDSGSLGLLKDVLACDPDEADALLDRLDVPRLTDELLPKTEDAAVGLGGHDREVDGAPPEEAEPRATEEHTTAHEEEEEEEDDKRSAVSADVETPGRGGTNGSHGSEPQAGDGERTGSGGGHRQGSGAHGGRQPGTRGAGARGRRPSRGERDPSEWWHVIASGRSDPSEDRALGRDEHERAARRSQVDAAGIEAVCRHERRAGREPEVKDHSHPGYDISSRDDSGEVVRHIEVKSLAGEWGEGGFPRITPTQFKHAQEEPDLTWLYVVEHAEAPEPRITRIDDPAGRVTRFVFDPGWRELGEEDDELVGLTAEIQALVAEIEAAGLPEPEFRFPLDGTDHAILDLAWPDFQVAVVTSLPEEADGLGWTIGIAGGWTIDDVRAALGV